MTERTAILLLIIASSILTSAGPNVSPVPEPVGGSESSLEPEFRELRERLSTVPEFSGDDVDSKFRLGEELAHRGDMGGAQQAYRSAIALNPGWADPYRGLGQVLLDHHEYTQAVEALQTSIRLGRDDQQAFYWLGRAFMGKHELPAAVVALERATDLNGDDAEAWADLGLVKMAQGDLVGSERAFAHSIRTKPDYAEAHRLRDLLVNSRQDRETAKKAAEAVLQEMFGKE
jgi:cytochrome c-type biogenesis protein CcmH/NrfG